MTERVDSPCVTGVLGHRPQHNHDVGLKIQEQAVHFNCFPGPNVFHHENEKVSQMACFGEGVRGSLGVGQSRGATHSTSSCILHRFQIDLYILDPGFHIPRRSANPSSKIMAQYQQSISRFHCLPRVLMLPQL